MHPRHKFHHTHISRHDSPNPRALVGFGLFVFLMFAFFGSGGWWVFFFLPWLFYMFKPFGMFCASDESGKTKNNEKPKRRVVETVDGEVLEVVDEPQRV